MWPELLYRLAGADVGTQWLNCRNVNQSVALANVLVNVDLVIPEDELWLINNICGIGIAGAAQTTDAITFSLRDVANSTAVNILFENTNLAGNLRDSIDRQFSGMPIRGPIILRGAFTFNAGVAINTGFMEVQATRIPRGNWTLT